MILVEMQEEASRIRFTLNLKVNSGSRLSGFYF